jgi:putative ABC transport system ATP-binding protein
MSEEKAVQLKDVWKIYRLGKVELVVLKGINLEIPKGDFIAIMGASGSGKSTLMYIIGCLDVPSRGKIFLGGRDISAFSENQLAQVRGKKIGFVFQQFNLLPNLNALENVMLPMVFQGVKDEERKERARNLLKAVHLENRFYHKPSELSGGERQRIAIARALANDPEVVLADEPTGNLDSATGKMIMEILTDLHRKGGRTIIVVTHDPNIAGYSQKIIQIKDGQITS